MLQLIQVINYMVNVLKYSEDQVIQTFEEIESGHLTPTDLYLELGLESPTDLGVKMFEEKLNKWRTALSVIKIRSE